MQTMTSRDKSNQFLSMRSHLGASSRKSAGAPEESPKAVATGVQLYQSIQAELTRASETLKDLRSVQRARMLPSFDPDEAEQLEGRMKELNKSCLTTLSQSRGAAKRFSALSNAIPPAAHGRAEQQFVLESMGERVGGDIAKIYGKLMSTNASFTVEKKRMERRCRQLTGTTAEEAEEESKRREVLIERRCSGFTEEQLAQLEIQESIVRERGQAIEELFGDLTEINQMFRDVQELVEEQGTQLDQIRTNIQSTQEHVKRAVKEVSKAREHQQKGSCTVM